MSCILRTVGRCRFIGAVRAMSTVDTQLPQYGSGAGKGGGAGGSIRESGGAFGVREAVMEEQYFRRLSDQQLEQLHSSMTEEIQQLQKQLNDLEEMKLIQRVKLRKLREMCQHDL